MFIGHLAAALAAKRIEPEIPLVATATAAFALDLVWPILLLAGVEVVRVDPGNTAFTHLAFESYPWTHSLATVLMWSAVGAAVSGAAFRSWRIGAVIGALVLSHWVLDWVTHRPDLPLWPNGPVTGLGLWNSVPGTILVEGGLMVLATWLYVRVTAPVDRTGSVALIGLLALTGLTWVSQPWAPPPPSESAVAWGTMFIWLLPLWAFWIEKHRRVAGSAG